MNTTLTGSPARVFAPTLDRFAALDWSDGVIIPQLAPHDRLIISTRNSTYEMIVTAPHTASVLVRGGSFFPDYTPVCVAGSSLGGSFLKLHCVYVGLQMELITENLPVITTCVNSLSIRPAGDCNIM